VGGNAQEQKEEELQIVGERQRNKKHFSRRLSVFQLYFIYDKTLGQPFDFLAFCTFRQEMTICKDGVVLMLHPIVSDAHDPRSKSASEDKLNARGRGRGSMSRMATTPSN